jgi:type I restriction enzyme S subunit
LEKTAGYSMVNNNLALVYGASDSSVDDAYYYYKPYEIKHTSISLKEVFNNKLRLEASAFSIESKIAKDKVTYSKYGAVNLYSSDGMIQDCYYGGRAKRNYVDKTTNGAIGFLGSSEMLDINPQPVKFLSSIAEDLEPYKVSKGTILISRSGTIGNTTYVSETLSRFLVSEHAIRLIAKEYSGYVYAYLKTDIGKTIVKSNTFGAVVDQVEPQHFENVLIPQAPDYIKNSIHEKVVQSYEMRDKSNELLDLAESKLLEELKLPDFSEFKKIYDYRSLSINSYSTKLSNLNLRFDGSYHLPLYNDILNHISSNSSLIEYLRNSDISERIVLPGRFKRTYVESEEHGIKFIGGKQISELSPNSEKYLSKSIHGTRLGEELLLHDKCILITRSGTIGKVTLVPKHWENWAANEHIIRVFPAHESIAGYLYCWLSSDYGRELIRKHTYGSVVDEIDANHVGDVPLPILKNLIVQKEINDLVLEANDIRYQAYLLENEAINQVNALIFDSSN